jgi:hypothetical protein
VPTQRSAMEMAVGTCTGVRMISAPVERHTSSNPGGPGVPVADQELARGGLVIEDGGDVPGLLGNPEAGGMGGDAGQLQPSAGELDEAQDVHPPQEDRVDGEAVAGHDPGGLLGQERPPACWDTPRRRVKRVGAQHSPDRAGRHPNAKAQQLTVDPLVAPPWVLAGQAGR